MSKLRIETEKKVRRRHTAKTILPTTDDIRRRAEQIYLETGNEDAESNWLSAEKELMQNKH